MAGGAEQISGRGGSLSEEEVDMDEDDDLEDETEEERGVLSHAPVLKHDARFAIYHSINWLAICLMCSSASAQAGTC